MRLFESLVNDFKERVINICYSYTNDLPDAEDVSQEVFIEVYRSLKVLRGKRLWQHGFTGSQVTRRWTIYENKKG